MTRRLALTLVVGLCLGPACSETGTEGPRLTEVQPSSGPSGAPTPIKILGSGFRPQLKANFDDGDKSKVSLVFAATLDGVALEQVTFVAAEQLSAVVPAGLAPGVHDLEVVDPSGRTAVLAAAFTVVGGVVDAGPDGPAADGAVPDAPAPDVSLTDGPLPDGPKVTTIAGSGTAGHVDGPALGAELDAPRGLVAVGGVVYVADYNNHCIRKIEGGVVSTFAGDCTAGYADGAAAQARFNLPDGLAADAAGAIYVADSGNDCIRKIEGGQVTTFAGANASGLKDGPLLVARFTQPRDLAFDGPNIYVADTGNHRLRLIEAGKVSTAAGSLVGYQDGASATARFSMPSGVAVAGGMVYIADTGNQRIRTFDAGVVGTLAGSGSIGHQDGAVAQATFFNPAGVLALGGKLYLADQANHAIRLIENGQVSTLHRIGSGYADGPLWTARFFLPRAIASGAAGTLYVSDQGNHRIRAITF